jgi:hypothetical protein
MRDASDSGVLIRHDNASLASSANGLVVAADDIAIWGLDLAGFPASCIVVEAQRAIIGGDRSRGPGNTKSGFATPNPK